MPSEKQIEEMRRKHRQNMKDALTAAEQAEPAPVARSGAVKVDEVMQAIIDECRDEKLLLGTVNAQDVIRKHLQAALEPADPATDVEPIPRADNCGRYLAELNDGRLLYLNHANTWQECQNFIARPTLSEARLREALESIANNACCGGCQEAALVARAALKEASE